MPFSSKAQERAAFSGVLGDKMKAAAPEWAKQTDQKSLPEHVGNSHMQKIAKERLAKMKEK